MKRGANAEGRRERSPRRADMHFYKRGRKCNEPAALLQTRVPIDREGTVRLAPLQERLCDMLIPSPVALPTSSNLLFDYKDNGGSLHAFNEPLAYGKSNRWMLLGRSSMRSVKKMPSFPQIPAFKADEPAPE
ncbi:hypothetical protein KM043_003749 [Ampulex compressa]|nr:hypothetical protein KM043_003749 [Ampulex compressa]